MALGGMLANQQKTQGQQPPQQNSDVMGILSNALQNNVNPQKNDNNGVSSGNSSGWGNGGNKGWGPNNNGWGDAGSGW